jgi:Leucine-rich repeat (LRR) protein
MRTITLFVFFFLTFQLHAQNKLIRKISDPEYKSLETAIKDYENFLKMNINDTDYNVQKKFNMTFTSSRFFKNTMKIWDDREQGKQEFISVFDYVKASKNKDRKNYSAKFVLNPLRKPDIMLDQLRRQHYLTLTVKKMETWSEIVERTDTLINKGTDSTLAVGPDTTYKKVTDTIVKKRSVDNVIFIRTALANNVFSDFKLFAVSIPGKQPELEPLSEEMQWWVALPDNWKKFFKDKFKLEDYPENYLIRKCQGLQELDLSTQPEISDISFLANFKFLTKLNLTKTKVKDLSPIQNLKSLKELNIALTKVDTLLYLKNLTGLEKLDISGLPIHSLENISGLVNMKELTCSENKLRDLLPLKNMTVLEELDISLNYDIKDVTPILGLLTLEKLVLKKVEIKTLEPLTQLQNLIWLDCYNAGISDLSPLRRLPKLMHIDVSHNSVQSIEPLRSLNFVTYLGLASTRVTDLSPISRYTNLEYLNVGGNPGLKDLSSVPDETLLTLICNYTGIPSGDVQRFKKKNPDCKITYY